MVLVSFEFGNENTKTFVKQKQNILSRTFFHWLFLLFLNFKGINPRSFSIKSLRNIHLNRTLVAD